jgi:hypothetical protein
MTLRQIVGLLALMGSAWLAFFADKTPGDDADLVAPTRSGTPAPRAQSPALASTAPNSAAPKTIQKSPAAETVLGLDERAKAPSPDAERTGAQAFGVRSWTPPPPPPAPVVPRAPALPFGFLGKKLQNGAWLVYLSVGEDMRLAQVASVIDGQYRVESIVPPRIEFTYLPLNERQTLDIGAP